ncbi:MAG: hypothetical protein KF804_13880 [Burkholderiales bacterium]|nr:hypothetical protein [Burkholderiales bacterium]
MGYPLRLPVTRTGDNEGFLALFQLPGGSDEEAEIWWWIECNGQRSHDALSGIPPAAYRVKNAAGNSADELSA